MGDTTVKKIDSKQSPQGKEGQKYLATGKSISMRLWQEEPDDKAKPASKRAYETVGYVIKGSAELHIEGQMVKLNEGDSWLVPKDAEHNYKILQSFTAVEATHPPAEIHDRDETVCAEDKTCADAKTCAEDKSSAADKTCVEDKTSAEDKTKQAQEIVGNIPRVNDEVTSNTEPREAQPAEHLEVETKK